MVKVNRNDPCPCGSGKKYKKCCLIKKDSTKRLSEHTKRMLGISSFVAPAPWTKEFTELSKKVKINQKNEKYQEFIESLFKKATNKVFGHLINGVDRLTNHVLREFYNEYNSRLFNHGLWTFPSSFNVVEAFLSYIPELNYFSLNVERNYLFSFSNYMDFMTSNKCNDDYADAINHFEENTIYHYDNIDAYKDLKFKSSSDDEFAFGGISFIRHGSELSAIMTVGHLADIKETEPYIKQFMPEDIKNHPLKKGIKPSEDRKRELVHMSGEKDLWQKIVLTRFDFTDMTQNVRYILEDIGDNYRVITDDTSIFLNDSGFIDEKTKNGLIKNCIEELELNSILFEICKCQIFLPMYFANYTDLINIERHPTRVKEFVDEDELINHVDPLYGYLYRNISVLTNTSYISSDIMSTKAPGLRVEKSGYWKKLKHNQVGTDKNSNPIHGKTWVKEELTWFYDDKDELIKLYKQQKEFQSEAQGYIYVMRSAAHDVDIFKIGMTKRSSQIRADELSRTTGVPDKFLVVNEWKVKDRRLAEKIIHEKLDKYRVSSNREFFRAEAKIIFHSILEVLDDNMLNIEGD